ncbi:MAG: hypothetical protein NVS1B10_03090 [Candidatus Saccharimonadales bacterium]
MFEIKYRKPKSSPKQDQTNLGQNQSPTNHSESSAKAVIAARQILDNLGEKKGPARKVPVSKALYKEIVTFKASPISLEEAPVPGYTENYAQLILHNKKLLQKTVRSRFRLEEPIVIDEQNTFHIMLGLGLGDEKPTSIIEETLSHVPPPVIVTDNSGAISAETPLENISSFANYTNLMYEGMKRQQQSFIETL